MRTKSWVLGRGEYRRCIHRSHRLGLRCRRYFAWDGLCYKHINSCYRGCPEDKQ